MSRIIVKNLPKSASDERLRELFSSRGEITDVKLAKTATGTFRRFAFVGFKTSEQAEAAVKYFNKAFMDTCRMGVELAKGIGDESIARPWSRYSKGSSRFERRHKTSEARKAGLTLAEYEEKVKAEEKAKMVSALKAKSKTNQMLEKLHQVENDPEFQEFLDAHQPKSKKAKWANDEERSKLQKDGKDSTTTIIQNRFVEASADEREEKGGDEEHRLSDMDYLKSKVSTRADAKKKDNSSSTDDESKSDEEQDTNEPKEIAYTVKMRGIPFKATEDDVRRFFEPLDIREIRMVQTSKGRPSGRAFVDFFSSNDQTEALKRHKDYMGNRYVEVTLDDGIEKWQEMDQQRKSSATPSQKPWEARATLLPGEEEPIADSGRLFVRNLSYTCTEEELGELFGRFGPLTETFVPVDRVTKKPMGFAFVTYLMPEHAVKAFNELDRSAFQGRLLHVLPSRTSSTKAETIDESDSFKRKRDGKAKAASQSSHNWNSLFLNSNAIAEAIAAKYNVSKGAVLDPATSRSLAVRMALGETEVIQETKDFLESHGVRLNAFETNVDDERSKTTILVKNLPFETSEADLRLLFSPFGDLGRVVCPPTGVTGIVEFTEAKRAKKAFAKLAYAKFRDVPLYLEWAPLRPFAAAVATASVKETSPTPEDCARREPAVRDGGRLDESKTPCRCLFVKNLNFGTNEEALTKVFQKIGKVDSVVIARKKDAKSSGNLLSMGYGFIEFQRAGDAKEALKRLQGYQLEGHALELKFSNRDKNAARGLSLKKATKKDQTSAKILVRNVPFEATLKEIREIFQAFGEIKTLRLPKKAGGKQTGHRGFAFVEYLTKDDARRAFQSLVHSTHVYGRRLVLEWADEADSLDVLRQKTADHFYAASLPKKRKMTIEPVASDDDDDEDLQ
ncbi:probable RNA-binding protein 19 [Oscarella lobularis]|uniref:probable RNA-binding protein 19 n=1 Tax=Oscarella lobularis TaxID=121494 RepID=UPI003313CD07